MNAKSFDVGIVNCGELNVDICIELAMVRYCILRRKPFQAFLQKTSTTTDSGCCSHCLSWQPTSLQRPQLVISTTNHNTAIY